MGSKVELMMEEVRQGQQRGLGEVVVMVTLRKDKVVLREDRVTEEKATFSEDKVISREDKVTLRDFFFKAKTKASLGEDNVSHKNEAS